MELEQKGQPQALIDLKVILLGNVSVGKTSFVNRYISGSFTEKPSTLGASFLLKIWGAHKFAIWDTSGEERFRGLSRYYCRGAGAVIMAFDLTNENSFHSLRKEFVPLLSDTLDGRRCAVVGMKSDLLPAESKSQFREEGMKLAKELSDESSYPDRIPLYFETSSLTGDCVNIVFESLFQSCLPLVEKNGLEASISLNKTNENKPACFC